jgi:hypothetical protein
MTRFLALTLALASLSPAFAQVPDYVPTDGLVGWYSFDFDASDKSDNNNDSSPLNQNSFEEDDGREFIRIV